MSKKVKFSILIIIIIAWFGKDGYAQPAVRFSQQIVTQNLPPGNYSPNAISTAIVIVNGTTYTDNTASTTCNSAAPVTLNNSNVCQATPDINGNIGFWMIPGSYSYWLKLTAGQMIGPYYFVLGGGPFTPQFPNGAFITTVSHLPSASLNTNIVYMVTDGSSGSDCTVGGGSTRVWCVSNGTIWQAMSGSGGGSGTVTSVGLSLPNIFSVSGSPVTNSGTLTGALVSQSANLFLSSPNGAPGVPTFRAIVPADLTLFSSGANGIVSASGGGTTNFLRADGTWAAPPSGSGTVTSFSAGNLSPLFTTSVATATTTPALSFTLSSQTQNLFYASPSGSTGNPSFRAIVGADLPNPSSSTLGGVQSLTGSAHNFLTGINTSGVPQQAQPAFSDISGSNTCAQLPALTGDTTTSAGSCATTTAKINGTSFPTSSHGIASNSSAQPVNMTAHDNSSILTCAAASASGTAYTCTTTPSFTPATGDRILFKADVANTGSATLNVNSSAADTIEKQGGGTVLAANDLLAGTWCAMIFDASNHWQMQCPSGNSTPTNPYTAIVTGNWSAIGTGCTTANTTAPFGGAGISVIGSTGSANICGEKVAATGNFTHILAFYYMTPQSNFETASVGFTDGTKVEYCGVNFNSSGNIAILTAATSTALSGGTYASAPNTTTTWTGVANPVWFRLTSGGGATTLKCEFSPDGVIWNTIFNDNSGSPFLTVSNVYVAADPRGGTGTSQVSLVSYQ